MNKQEGKLSTAVCYRCGTTFEFKLQAGRPRLFCSQACGYGGRYLLRQNSKVERHCIACGKAFYIWPSTLVQGPALFCSRTCYSGEHRAARLKGKRGKKWTPELRERMRARPGKAKLPSIIKACIQCHKPFQVDRHRSRRETIRFCRTACWYEWIRKDASRHPCWKGGYQPYYGPNWLAQARLARERDGNRCQSCGKNYRKRAMDVHHVKPIRECRDWQEANELSNLVSLCNPCHLKVRGTNGLFRLRLL